MKNDSTENIIPDEPIGRGNTTSKIRKPMSCRRKRDRENIERLLELKNAYAEEPIMTIDEYCIIIADWIMTNPKAIVVLDFYSTQENYPIQYRLEQVLERNHPAITAVLAERILSLSLQGRLNGTVAKPLLNKKFNLENSIQVTNGEMVFKFGE